MTLTIEPLAPIGARVHGATPAALLNDDDVPGVVMDALEANGVLVFPELGLDDREQVEFAGRLGEIAAGRSGRSLDFPEIYQVGFGPDLNNELYVKGSFFWHIDGTTDERPSKASLLSGRRLAAVGGDTQFVSTYRAYERLSAAERDRYGTLKVVHSAESAYRWFEPDPSEETLARLRRTPTPEHPLVWTHRSGRKSLVLGTTADRVVGMPAEEGRELLHHLLGAATAPEHVYTHHWSVGDLVIWDNRGTLHRATPYGEDSGRMMHRVTLVGDEAIR
jgi:alpha-ketoglutarate-dependent taurine dioxygenase